MCKLQGGECTTQSCHSLDPDKLGPTEVPIEGTNGRHQRMDERQKIYAGYQRPCYVFANDGCAELRPQEFLGHIRGKFCTVRS